MVSIAALPLVKEKFILTSNLNAPCCCLNTSQANLHRQREEITPFFIGTACYVFKLLSYFPSFRKNNLSSSKHLLQMLFSTTIFSEDNSGNYNSGKSHCSNISKTKFSSVFPNAKQKKGSHCVYYKLYLYFWNTAACLPTIQHHDILVLTQYIVSMFSPALSTEMSPVSCFLSYFLFLMNSA